MKKHWYKITIYYCPLCGKETEYRERQYTKKPKDVNKRIITIYHYDYCED
jgi:hypothetical protein